MSSDFTAVAGDKQGEVLSPVLLCLYIDDLLLSLSRSGVGCYVGSHFAGALTYADDIVLIALTATAMRKLLGICGNYATEYCITFNAAKSKCLVVLPKNRRCLLSVLKDHEFVVNNTPIEFVDSFVHLGHVLTSHLDDGLDIANRRSSFIGQVNNMLCFFRKLQPYVKFKLFGAYCTSFYGCKLWSLTSDCIEDLSVAWRKSIRAIWNLPSLTHCYLLPLICRCLPVFDEICRRSLKFIRACINNESSLVRGLAFYGITFARNESFLGRNVLFCADRYHCAVNDILHGSINNIINSYVKFNTTDARVQTADLLCELLNIRESRYLFLTNFSSE